MTTQQNPKFNFSDTLFGINTNDKIEPLVLLEIKKTKNGYVYCTKLHPTGINENRISDSIYGCMKILEMEATNGKIQLIQNANIATLQANVEMWHKILFNVVGDVELLPKPPLYKAKDEIEEYYANKDIYEKSCVLSANTLASKTIYLLLLGLGIAEIMQSKGETLEDIANTEYLKGKRGGGRSFIPYFIYFAVWGSDYLNISLDNLKEVWQKEKGSEYWQSNLGKLDLEGGYSKLLEFKTFK